MNDFSDIENELKRLRPTQPSAELAARIERALAEPASPATAGLITPARKIRWDWVWLGSGVAAAALLLVFAVIDSSRPTQSRRPVAARSPSSLPAVASSYIPDGLTRVVYDTHDEGVHFATDNEQPVRRLRARTRETLTWRNPKTGASLRVSYPSEEVSLVPVSGQ